MQDPADQLRSALTKCEGYCELSMWEQAANVLDDLADELRTCAEVYEFRLEICIGVRNWECAVILAESLASRFPHRPAAWFRLACAQAQLGNVDAAKETVKVCSEIDPEMRLRMLNEPLLSSVWP
jgi:hypothetical protein